MQFSFDLKAISADGEDQLWSRLSQSFAGRLAGVLFFFYGFLVLVTSPLALRADTNRSIVYYLGIIAMATGLVTWYIPWKRWSIRATLVLPVFAFIVISVLDAAVDNVHAQYGALFLVVFAWLGLCHPRGTSTYLLPIAAVLYGYPLILISHYSFVTILGSVSYLAPSWWLLGETVAWISSRLVKTEESLKEREESFRRLFANNPQPMWIYEPDTLHFLEVNQATVDQYGFTRSEFLDMSLSEISLPRDEVGAGTKGSQLEDMEPADIYQTVTASKEIIEIRIATNLLSFNGSPAVLAVVNDVTAQNRLEGELRYQASHDSLTGLLNRSSLVRLLDSKIPSLQGEKGFRSLYLVVVDLDRFKDINYGLGHIVGDQVLIECAKRLSSELPKSHSVARLGGDEFGIVVSSETAVNEREIAESIIEIIGRVLRTDDEVILRIDASMGIVELPKYGANAVQALRNADIAMYRAKRDKHHWAIFNSDDEQDRLGHLTLGTDLRQAIEDGLIKVVYQAMVEFATGEVRAAEVLARWDHPSRGPIDPDIFIPVAEQIGVIGPLTSLVMDESLMLCKDLQIKGHSISVAINVSSHLLTDLSFADMIGEALQKYGIAPEFLICEITESVLIEKINESLSTLERLRNLGVRISLDDFGTGYSSLSYLRDLPIDELKIDRAFVTNLRSDKGLREIVRGIIEVSHALSIKVVAEGVEDDETAAVLKRLGCDVGQGYLYSHPLGGNDFRDWILSHLMTRNCASDNSRAEF